MVHVELCGSSFNIKFIRYDEEFLFFSAEDVLYQVMYLGLFVEFLVLKRAVRPRVRALSLVLFLSTELGYNGRSTLHISSYLSRRDSQKSAASE